MPGLLQEMQRGERLDLALYSFAQTCCSMPSSASGLLRSSLPPMLSTDVDHLGFDGRDAAGSPLPEATPQWKILPMPFVM